MKIATRFAAVLLSLLMAASALSARRGGNPPAETIDPYGVTCDHANEGIESAGKVITVTSDGLIVIFDADMEDGDLLTALWRNATLLPTERDIPMNPTMTNPTRTLYKSLTLDEERALYGITHADVISCLFDGPADGESALKEASDITVTDCEFRLRYPFWHTRGGRMMGCTLTDTCRAALWYTSDMVLEDSALGGIKALRECDNTTLTGCAVDSAEFGWLCRGVALTDCRVKGEYPFFMTRGLRLKGVELKGKYSFQYVEDCTVTDSCLDTKDAFWHAKNVTVMDSTVKGEYLGWYSEGLTLVRCRIEGTQPLCYCKNLTLIDCEMVGCDLAFENSAVTATVRGHVDSIKSPASGRIEVDSVGEIVYERAPVDGQGCEILVR